MNFLLAVFLFWITFMMGVKSFGIFPFGHSESLIMPSLDYALEKGLISGSKEDFYPKIAYVVSGYTAFDAGLQSGDIILKINGQEVNFITMKDVIQQNCGKKIELTIQRGNQILTKKVFVDPEKNCKIGVLPVPAGNIQFKEIKLSPIQALGAAFKETREETKLTFTMLGNLIKKLLTFDKEQVKEAVSQFSGPVGAVKIGEIILQEF
jgi:membrane-associated protease RseP (regulator of RpoE activity)